MTNSDPTCCTEYFCEKSQPSEAQDFWTALINLFDIERTAVCCAEVSRFQFPWFICRYEIEAPGGIRTRRAALQLPTNRITDWLQSEKSDMAVQSPSGANFQENLAFMPRRAI